MGHTDNCRQGNEGTAVRSPHSVRARGALLLLLLVRDGALPAQAWGSSPRPWLPSTTRRTILRRPRKLFSQTVQHAVVDLLIVLKSTDDDTRRDADRTSELFDNRLLPKVER